MVRNDAYSTIRVIGGFVPDGTLSHISSGRRLPGLEPNTYGLQEGDNVRLAASRAWPRLLNAWRRFQDRLAREPAERPATSLTRDAWSRYLFQELGYGYQLPRAPAEGLRADGTSYQISHVWNGLPIHLVGARVALDRAAGRGPTARRRAPFSLVQDFLNRTDQHLWGFVSNGLRLMLLHNSASMTRRSYIEFDLEAMFEHEVFPDFVVLYAIGHASGFVASAEGEPPRTCWMERWRQAAISTGVRAREQLREGVTEALRILGQGFVKHPDNNDLRAALELRDLSPQDYYRLLLRLVYQLLFCFIVEERGLLHAEGTDPEARRRYETYFSMRRLRRLAARDRVSGPRHHDQWAALRLVLDALSQEGSRELALPALDSQLFDLPMRGVSLGGCKVFHDAVISNQDLLKAIRALSLVRDRAGATEVDYRNLDAEELGSVYESLLELSPGYDPPSQQFSLKVLPGNERKTTGSYYTSDGLVKTLLDTTLEPLLDERMEGKAGPDAVKALLDVTVCDPSCGSGHFLLAAARRIARRVAVARTGEPEPPERDLRAATRDVINRCIYGVDVNEMAVELARFSLCLEAYEPGRPLLFLAPNIRVGDALLGTTPALLARGVPDAAFKPLSSDDRAAARSLMHRNKQQRAEIERGTEQLDLFHAQAVCSRRLYRLAFELTFDDAKARCDTLEALQQYRDAWTALWSLPERQSARLAADAWCAAFAWPKVPNTTLPPTVREVARLLEPASLPEGGRTGREAFELAMYGETWEQVESLAREYRFFHWHLEFPQIFQVPDHPDDAEHPELGWSGGFSCMIGNPPWERVKLQEQEFFATRNDKIARAPNAAARKRLIDALRGSDAKLFEEFTAARHRAEARSLLLRESGRYPLCGRGDINTYAVFAELYRALLAPDGRMGVVLPTGIGTDATTQHFFRDLVRSRSLAAFLDFENEAFLLSRAVDHRVRFCLLSVTGARVRVGQASFAFSTRYLEDLPARRFTLTPEEILLLNPNTGTCPVFRSRRDAEITLGIYRRVPVLVKDLEPRENPWQVSFLRMFDLTNDSSLFKSEELLRAAGAKLEGNVFLTPSARYLPLYEAKMLHFFDHRYGTYEGQTQAQANVGTLPRLGESTKNDPASPVLPRYWVAESEVRKKLDSIWSFEWLIGFRDITLAKNERTFIPSILPLSAVGNSFPLLLVKAAKDALYLLANLSSFVLDYVARLKASGSHMNFFIVQQLPVLDPVRYMRPTGWLGQQTVGEWVYKRSLELAYTTWDLRNLADDAGLPGPPYKWQDVRRAQIRAELDAAYFYLYGVPRSDVEYILETFPVVKERDMLRYGEYRTKRLILEIYDRIVDATTGGPPFDTTLDPPPGQGPRHPERDH